MTFTIDGAQWTYEADINRKKCKLVNFARHQAQTRMVSNFMRFQEHSDNFPIAHDSERGWVVVRLEEIEQWLNSNVHACEKPRCLFN